jgi:thioredoxin-dependent peroxiredoxin
MIETGQKAPELNINDQNGTLRTIAEFKGKKLVLYFYPKDDTPGCTAEACDLRDNYSRFLSEGYTILGVSPDTEAKHQKFIAKYELPFDLLADTEHTVAIAFGVWVEKSMYGKQYMGIARKTFIINENGLIETVIDKVNTKAHTAQIL